MAWKYGHLISACAAAASCFTGAARAQFSCPTPSWSAFDPLTATFPGADSTVLAETMWDPDGNGPTPPVLVAVGAFQTIGGAAANYVATYNPASGLWSPLGTGTNWWIDCATARANGDLIVGGTFTEAGGVPAVNIARWNGSAWSSLAAPFDAGVSQLATLSNGDVVASGLVITAYDPELDEYTYEHRLERWNGSTWTNMGAALDIYAGQWIQTLLALPGGKLLIGGTFGTIGGVPANNIATWDAGTWSALGTGTDGQVQTLARSSNGDIYVGGRFLTAGAVSAQNIAKWNGTDWSALGSGIGGLDYAITFAISPLTGGGVAVGGYFSDAGGVPAAGIAKWSGSAWSAYGNGVAGEIHAIAQLANGDLFAGGYFTAAGNVPARCLARWNGTDWAAAGTGADDTIDCAIRLPNGDVVVGGHFTTIGGTPALSVARWNGSAWSALGGGLQFVNSEGTFPGQCLSLLAMPNGDIFAGGIFNMADGAAVSRSIARWDGSSWSSVGTGMSVSNGFYGEAVSSLVLAPNADVVAGGDFVYAGDAYANCIAAWDGTQWNSFADGVDGGEPSFISAIAMFPNGQFVAGGAFQTAGGVPAANVARWDGSAWNPLGLGIEQWVYDVVLTPSGDVVAGGSFANVGGESLVSIAQWNGTAWSGMSTGLTDEFGTQGEVVALNVQDNGDIVAAGTFTRAGGLPVSNIARWDGSAWSGVGDGANGAVRALTALDSDTLLATGAFTRSGSLVLPYLARIGCNGCPSDFNNDGFVTGDDFDGYVAAFELGEIAADFNHDGFVTGDDFDAYVLAFETGC